MRNLDGKRAWITGGGTGIGAGAALALADAGAQVVVSGRRLEPLQKVVDLIEAEGGLARAELLDVSDTDAVAAAAERIGQVDILLANAGLNVPKRALFELSDEDWRTVVDVNLNGVFHPVRAVLPGMRARGGGQVILISSWAGRYPGRLTGAAYNATKRAVIALGESINEEGGAHGIRATVIMPGEVATEIMDKRPMPPSQAERARMLQVDDLAATVRFVAEMPPHACINEVLISPTHNRFYQGFEEM
ncbi:SDR family oxidoreductase [Antarcticimicrobium luteum]|uniref:SDR family NAD(P)-dependent oxidoreductase n=1 Tax=Antarcticimicrobium luteum TaxID=2547397 RepID=A0A4R5UQ56_9RHOB|nr:SDR family NAD(P)-dependent oxidoreductase [Antarcticimicrobium luteum]TDK41152.1 SDR family NAD(P)-dependent oxidoreductase [Antarcticimicrobium luteum]